MQTKNSRIKKGIVTFVCSATLMSTALFLHNSVSEVEAATNTNWVRVTYTSHLRQGAGTNFGTSRYLNPGERYNYYETKQSGGFTWYRLTPNEWVANAGAEAYQSSSPNGATGSDTETGNNTNSQSQYGWLKIDYATNLRKGPGTGYGVSRVLGAGVKYNYYEVAQANGYTWYRVTPNEWVASAGASITTAPQPSDSTNGSSGSDTSSNVQNQFGWVQINHAGYLRQGPGTNYGISRTLNAGEKYNYYAVTQAGGYTWYRLTPNEWVASASASVSSAPQPGNSGSSSSTGQSSSAKVQAVINLAKQQLGKPYVWGAKGPNSFDCSGLMYYIFQNGAGVNIGGWTVPQESAGSSVSLSALQPGDILFWGSRGSSYHDAIYIGNNQYINAPQPGDVVKVQSISGYFMPSFAVRVL
jgi:cell wall-associated NlpC family hydrolase